MLLILQNPKLKHLRPSTLTGPLSSKRNSPNATKCGGFPWFRVSSIESKWSSMDSKYSSSSSPEDAPVEAAPYTQFQAEESTKMGSPLTLSKHNSFSMSVHTSFPTFKFGAVSQFTGWKNKLMAVWPNQSSFFTVWKRTIRPSRNIWNCSSQGTISIPSELWICSMRRVLSRKVLFKIMSILSKKHLIKKSLHNLHQA